MSEWNRNTQPYLAIAKEADGKLTDNLRKKPGHMLNYNTSKSDISLVNHGITIDNSDPNNPVKLQLGYGANDQTATIGLYQNGNAVNTKTLADTLTPTQIAHTGDACNVNEIGKIVENAGNSATNSILNRNTLICTQNLLMCSSVSSTGTCYLPATANRVVFQNNQDGVQSNNGGFTCPQEVPFALSATSSLGGTSGITPSYGMLSGYTVMIGYSTSNVNVKITQVTCSNMPDYSINDIPH